MANVLVSGASGLVGERLLPLLAARGYKAARLVREYSAVSQEDVFWDPAAGELDPDALEGVEAVVHLAGESIAAGRWNAVRKERIRESRVAGTKLLCSKRAEMPHPRAGEGGILLLGLMDTVHTLGTLARLPYKREGDICYGPGLMDMKGGNYVYLDALRKLQAAGVETPLPVTVLFTPDEEIGTPATRRLSEEEAKRHKYILVPEPARPDGGAVIGRYAIARFNLQTRGRPSHAGWALSEGRAANGAVKYTQITLQTNTNV